VYDVLQVAAALAVAALGWYAFVRLMTSRVVRRRVADEIHPMVVSAGRWLIVLITVIVILRVLGFSAGQVLASLSAFALVAAVAFFAYWSVLSNGTCSLFLYLFQPFRVGDWIEMRENENNVVAAGEVTGINLVFVSLTHVDDEGVENEFQIPTNLMFQRTIRVVRGKDTKSLGQHYVEHHGQQSGGQHKPGAGDPTAQ
jgi:small-conductance mechanosensitive channel